MTRDDYDDWDDRRWLRSLGMTSDEGMTKDNKEWLGLLAINKMTRDEKGRLGSLRMTKVE